MPMSTLYVIIEIILHAPMTLLSFILKYLIDYIIRGHSTTTWTRRGGGGVSQKSTLVHSRGGGGQKWSKFGPRSC